MKVSIRLLFSKIFVLSLLILIPDKTFAQSRKSSISQPNAINVQVDSSLANKEIQNKYPRQIAGKDLMSDRNFILSFSVLIFGLLIIIICTILVYYSKMSSEILMKVVTVSVASTSSLFLVVAGYTAEQIAPAFGLLGTLVGYLLGQKNTPS